MSLRPLRNDNTNVLRHTKHGVVLFKFQITNDFTVLKTKDWYVLLFFHMNEGERTDGVTFTPFYFVSVFIVNCVNIRDDLMDSNSIKMSLNMDVCLIRTHLYFYHEWKWYQNRQHLKSFSDPSLRILRDIIH